MTAKICSTTGRGAAKKRALAAVTSAPRASSARRTEPARAGTRLNRMSPAGMSQSERREITPANGCDTVRQLERWTGRMVIRSARGPRGSLSEVALVNLLDDDLFPAEHIRRLRIDVQAQP